MTTMTMTQLVAAYNELATKLGKPTRKGFDNKTVAEGALGALRLEAGKNKGGVLKVRKARTPAATREKGPRGFKFGPVWLASIAEGKGVALKPQNLPKLKDTAQHYNVEITKDLNQAEIAALIAKAL